MNKYLKVGIASFSILFLELLLIRYIGTEIRIFAYFSNLLLLAIFLGTGLGMIIKKELPLELTAGLLTVLISIVISGSFVSITDLLAPINENTIWFQAQGGNFSHALGGLVMTTSLFFIVIFTFAPLGQYLGKIFNKYPETIKLYSTDIIAAIIGMWAFYALSIGNISPLIGVLIGQGILILLGINNKQRLYLLIPLGISMILVGSVSPTSSNTAIKEMIWSPYQKLSLTEYKTRYPFAAPGYLLRVNNAVYMTLVDLSDTTKKKIIEQADKALIPKNYNFTFADQYQIPYFFKRNPENVLIAGAGGGNDLAAAIRNDSKHIDAVEIDPGIIEIGKKYHPEKPYSAPNVTIINDDARAWFKRSDKQYDLIIMGLADSHTLSSSLTNIRLDHYLYTVESFKDIKKLLKPDGLLVISFDVKKEWIGGRIQKSLTKAFDSDPLVIGNLIDGPQFGLGGVFFIVANNPEIISGAIKDNAPLRLFVNDRLLKFSDNVTPLTDDWPYLYLDHPRIPQIHLWILSFIALFSLPLMRYVPIKAGFRWDLFLMGAGFLLFEFQNITKTALLYGNTWTTSLFAITGALAMILLGNLIQTKRPISLNIAFVLLFATFILQITIPLELLNNLPYNARVLWGSLFLSLPFLFSGIIFITLFKKAEDKSSAFASNLLGSAIGGILEVLSFLTGTHSLLLISFVFYLMAFILYKRSRYDV